MATSKNIIQKTSRDFNSISQDLIASMSNITEEWLPGDETDPGIVYLKVASMLGDMLSYNRDRGTISMFPQTVTERQDAYRLFKSLGYRMKWYRAAQSKLTLSFSGIPNNVDIVIPKYTTFKTKTTGIKYCYVGKTISDSSAPNGQVKTIVLNAIQGEPVRPPVTASALIPRTDNLPWHSVYGYNVSVSDVQEDVYIKLDHTKIAEDSIVLIDDNGMEWKETKSLADVEKGRYFELFINSYSGVYIKLAEKPSYFNVSKFKLFYVTTSGKSGRITNDVIDDTPITPVYQKTQQSELVKINQNIKISNTSSVGGYDFETAEEARKEYEKNGANVQTLVTVDDFENDLKTVDGVDQCKVYDSQSFSETHRDFLIKADSFPINKTIYISKDNNNFPRFGNCDVWLSSIRIYCRDTTSNVDMLVFSGAFKKDASNPNKYSLTRSQSDVPTGSRESASFIVKNMDATNTQVCNSLSITINQEASSPHIPTGYYWIEYMLTRENGFVGFDVIPNITDYPSVYTLDDIRENIDEEITDKKHAYIEYNTDFEPYSVVWSPMGELDVSQSITNKEMQRLMSNIDLVFKEQFKNKNSKYNQKITSQDISDALKMTSGLPSSTSCSVKYHIPIETDDGKILYFSTERTREANMSKRITVTRTVTPKWIEPVSGTPFENGGWQFSINLGEAIELKAGTVRVSVNYNDIVFSDNPIRYSKDGLTDSGYGTEPQPNNANYGVLLTSSNQVLDQTSYVLYDTVNTKIQLTDTTGFVIGDNLTNLTFATSSDYEPNRYNGSGIPVQISFETTCDLFCMYNGYDPDEFYVKPEYIRSDYE